jgi:hypothetical protein
VILGQVSIFDRKIEVDNRDLNDKWKRYGMCRFSKRKNLRGGNLSS